MRIFSVVYVLFNLLKILKILDNCYVLRLDEARSATVAVDTRRFPATLKIRLTGRERMFKSWVELSVLFHVRLESLPQHIFWKLSSFESRFPRLELKNESYFSSNRNFCSTVQARKRSNAAKNMYVCTFLREMGLPKWSVHDTRIYGCCILNKPHVFNIYLKVFF